MRFVFKSILIRGLVINSLSVRRGVLLNIFFMVLTIFLLLINDMMICFGSSLLGTFEARLPCSLLYLCGVLRLDSPENPLLHGPYVGVVQELDLEQIYFQLFPKNVKVTTSKARLLNIMSSASFIFS